MSLHPILVTGATGKSGSRVVSQLRAKGIPVRVASRSSQQRFDWTDRSTWDPVLDGVKAVYIVPLDGTTLTRPFVERAVLHGVERIVLASARGVDVPDYAPDSSGLAATFGDGEDAVRHSGVEWTITRPGWFAQNFSEGFFSDAIRAGELRLPAGDGAASFVDAEDIAAVVVAALTEDGSAGQTYELSGPRAVTLAEAVATISEATGREIRYVPLSVEDYVAELVAQGVPATDAQVLADMVSPLREGKDDYLSDGVQRALGRPPRDFTAFVKATAAAGGWRG
ncbi:SDR family oxidoreductase [Nonomuraea sp. NPDC059194]|uniref:SDR family oxidoreductase n=1 Tax=Nonomuraea sp. NPDC059194 TaxID=3346764 RepID=UPI0036BD2A42